MTDGPLQDDYHPDPLEDRGWSPPSLQQPAGFWRTKDERVLSIAEMGTEHIKSAVVLFTRYGYGDHAKLGELRGELARRGVAVGVARDPSC